MQDHQQARQAAQRSPAGRAADNLRERSGQPGEHRPFQQGCRGPGNPGHEPIGERLRSEEFRRDVQYSRQYLRRPLRHRARRGQQGPRGYGEDQGGGEMIIHTYHTFPLLAIVQ